MSVEVNFKILLHTSAGYRGRDVVIVCAAQEKMPPATCGRVAQGQSWLACTAWLLHSLQ